MTQDEFFVELKKAHAKDPFRVKEDYFIRQGESDSCPICAVTKEVTGTHYNNSSFHDAAEKIGLDRRLASVVVDAADDIHTIAKAYEMRQLILDTLNMREI